MNYRIAEEVRSTAKKIIGEHHAHLLGLRVECVFTDKTAKSRGREVPGRTKKVSGLPAFLASPSEATGESPDFYSDDPSDFFVIEVSEEVWERLSESRRVALVDHLLSHAEIETDEETGTAKLSVVGPDVSEFTHVLARHGAWNEGLKDFAEQLSLIEDGTPVGGESRLEAVR